MTPQSGAEALGNGRGAHCGMAPKPPIANRPPFLYKRASRACTPGGATVIGPF